MLKKARKFLGTAFALVLLVPVLFTSTGCANSNEAVNQAFANSVLMNDIVAQLQAQVDLVAELKRMGVISDTMAVNLDGQLMRIFESAKKLNTSESGQSVVDAQRNEFIATVIQSLTYINEPDGAATSLTDTATAEQYVKDYGSSIDAYSGYTTKKILKETSYDGVAKYSGKDADAIQPFGPKGNSTITDFVAYLNKLKDIRVYYIDPNKVKDTKAFQGLKLAINGAQADADLSNQLALDYFIDSGDTINFTSGTLTEGDAYTKKTISVVDGGHVAVKYNIFTLNRDVILGAFNKTSQSGDLSSGVLIGNKYFITRYPVAVFRGFEQVSTDKTKFFPVFTHPTFLTAQSGYSKHKGSLFSGSAPYTDTLVEGDIGTSEARRAFIDLYTGVMYFDGEQIGNANNYMSTGTDELESSFAVLPHTSVYLSNNNPKIITTYPQTTKFDLKDTVQVGAYNATTNPPVNLPGVSGNLMPVVFLMDYLELVYSPNVVGSDAVTAYGRKVRLDEKVILGDKALNAASAPVAYIVGEGATKTGWGTKADYMSLTMPDFMDIDGLYNTDLTSKSKDVSLTNMNEATTVVHYIASNSTAFEKAGVVLSGDVSSERADSLPQIAAGKSLECTVAFGDLTINPADVRAEPKTPLYGVMLTGGLYERNLFSDWINASGNAPLTKWGKTVQDLGYKSYAISNAVLTEKMKGNYSFELNEDGLLNIDLEVIVDINKENTEERRGGGVMLLRTALMILGFVLISYVSVLLASWSLDVQLDLGQNMLSKVTLGHFVAVRSLDEMPPPDPNSTTTYLDFRSLMLRCLAFAAIGVILLTIDPVNLLVKLLVGLKFVISEISKKLFGVEIF